MRRVISRLTVAALLLVGSVSLTGCIVAAPRPVRHARVVAPVRVWVPGYWAPQHVWVEGRWRYR
jgi:hypothetical protein